MRKLLFVSLTAGLLFGGSEGASAADEAQAIIARAIKAHTGKARAAKLTAYQHKSKCTLELNGGLAFTQEVTVQFPGKYKEVMQGEVNGQQYTVTTVFNGKEGWITVNGKHIKVDDKLQAHLKEASYAMNLSQLTGFKDKTLKLDLLGEIQVNDRPAVGVRVSSKGHKDISLYFDKKTGLLAKSESRVLDFGSGQEVTQEVIVSAYHEIEGRKMVKKAVVNRDGKKFMESEVTEAKLLEKFDDSEFAKP